MKKLKKTSTRQAGGDQCGPVLPLSLEDLLAEKKTALEEGKEKNSFQVKKEPQPSQIIFN